MCAVFSHCVQKFQKNVLIELTENCFSKTTKTLSINKRRQNKSINSRKRNAIGFQGLKTETACETEPFLIRSTLEFNLLNYDSNKIDELERKKGYTNTSHHFC